MYATPLPSSFLLFLHSHGCPGPSSRLKAWPPWAAPLLTDFFSDKSFITCPGFFYVLPSGRVFSFVFFFPQQQEPFLKTCLELAFLFNLHCCHLKLSHRPVEASASDSLPDFPAHFQQGFLTFWASVPENSYPTTDKCTSHAPSKKLLLQQMAIITEDYN